MKTQLLVVTGFLVVLLASCASTPSGSATPLVHAKSIVGIEFENTSPPFVINVTPGGPAYRSGIREGDYVLAVDGNAGAQNIQHYVAALPPDSSVSVIYVHDRIQHQVTLKTAEPLTLFSELQAEGNPAGPTGLAELELTDYNMPKGTPPAKDLLKQAVAKDYALAMVNLGTLYLSESDADRGLALLTQAAQQNELQAYFGLMRYYFQKRDSVHIVEVSQKDAALNDPVGEHVLGNAYLFGRGGLDENHKKGMQLLWHAAERGYVPAIDSLASEYASGQHIPKNILQSYLWSTLAGKFGDANAPKTIAYLNEKQPLNEMQKERLASGVDSWLRYFQRTNDPESPGNVALSQGNLYAALQDDVNALQSLPDPAPIDVDKRLREQAITIVQRLKAPPSLPASATQYEIYGKTAAQSATDPDGLLGAIDNLRKATNVAPWWADGYYNLAVVEERAKDYADAARSLGFYLLAKPNAPDAASVQSRIYTLQFKAYHP